MLTVDVIFRGLTFGDPDSEAAKLMRITPEFGERRVVSLSPVEAPVEIELLARRLLSHADRDVRDLAIWMLGTRT